MEKSYGIAACGGFLSVTIDIRKHDIDPDAS